jgi:ubiquinol-cytochrome c reductase cytochrome c subunit
MGRNMVITMRAFMWTAVLSVFAFGAAHAQDMPKGDAKAGLAGYQKFGCYSCHGIVGQGTLRDGPRLNAAALGYPAILAQLRTPRYEMPAYTAVQISDSGVADIYAYLSSIPTAPDAKTIKALQ